MLGFSGIHFWSFDTFSFANVVSIQWAQTRLAAEKTQFCNLDWAKVLSLPVSLKSCPPSYFFIPLPSFLSLLFVPPSRALEPNKEAIQCDIFCDNFQKLSFPSISFPLKVPAVFIISFAPSFLYGKFFVSSTQCLSLTLNFSGWLRVTLNDFL